MLLKSLSHHNPNAAALLIKYVFDQRKNLLDNDGKSIIIKQHIRGYDKEGWIKQFRELEAIRKSKHSRSITMYHEVLSFSPKSTPFLNRSIIRDLIKQYLLLRGNNQLCVVGVHFDENIHAHILWSGLSREATSARISKSRYASVKHQLQAYQQSNYPLLSDSIVRNGLKKKA